MQSRDPEVEVLQELLKALEKEGLIPPASAEEKNEVIAQVLKDLKINEKHVPSNPSQNAVNFFKILLKMRLEINKLDPAKNPALAFLKNPAFNLVTFLTGPKNQIEPEMQRQILKLQASEIKKLVEFKKQIQQDKSLTPEQRTKLIREVDKKIEVLEKSSEELQKFRQSQDSQPMVTDKSTETVMDSVTRALIALFAKDPRSGRNEEHVTTVNGNMSGVVDVNPEIKGLPIDLSKSKEPDVAPPTSIKPPKPYDIPH